MTESLKKHFALRSITAVSYFAISLQWVWAGLMLIQPILRGDLSWLFFQKAAPDQWSGFDFVLPTPVAIVFVIVITAVMVMVSIYALVTMPRNISRGSAKVIEKTTEIAIPVVTKHRKVTKKERRRLSQHLSFGLRLAAIFLAFVLALLPYPDPPITRNVVELVALVLLTFSVSFMALEYILGSFIDRTRARFARKKH